jgi:hypothetical protein
VTFLTVLPAEFARLFAVVPAPFTTLLALGSDEGAGGVGTLGTLGALGN